MVPARTVQIHSAFALSVLLAASASHAAVFTVGAGGTYATIPAALTAAISTAGSAHELRLHAQTYPASLDINYTSAKAIVVTGGWNDTFSIRSGDPAVTAIAAAGTPARPLRVEVHDGVLAFGNLTLIGGNGNTQAGGAGIRTYGDGRFALSDCIVAGNTASGTSSVSGAGIYAIANDSSQLNIQRCTIAANGITGGGGSAGGGLHLSAYNTAQVLIEGNRIEDNSIASAVAGAPQLQSAGVQLYGSDASVITFRNNRIASNRIEAAAGAPVPTYGAEFSVSSAAGAARMALRGNVFHANSNATGTASGAHVSLFAQGTGNIVIGDSEISDGRGGATALELFALGASARLDATHLTIAGNAGIGVRTVQDGAGSLYNTIVAHNTQPGIAAAAWLVAGNNLIDIDPRFQSPSSGNYRLQSDSPALDAASTTPPATLGATDADGNPRTVGTVPDIGAYERGTIELFDDGFE